MKKIILAPALCLALAMGSSTAWAADDTTRCGFLQGKALGIYATKVIKIAGLGCKKGVGGVSAPIDAAKLAKASTQFKKKAGKSLAKFNTACYLENQAAIDAVVTSFEGQVQDLADLACLVP